MVQCCFTSTGIIKLIRTGSPGRPPRLSHSLELWRRIVTAQQWFAGRGGKSRKLNFSSIFLHFQNFLPYHIFLESLRWLPWHRLFLHTSSWSCFVFSSSNLPNLERPGFPCSWFCVRLVYHVTTLLRHVTHASHVKFAYPQTKTSCM